MDGWSFSAYSVTKGRPFNHIRHSYADFSNRPCQLVTPSLGGRVADYPGVFGHEVGIVCFDLKAECVKGIEGTCVNNSAMAYEQIGRRRKYFNDAYCRC